ncbi:MAG: hypothetical protein V4642_09525 [Bacteroidota bacterium]
MSIVLALLIISLQETSYAKADSVKVDSVESDSAKERDGEIRIYYCPGFNYQGRLSPEFNLMYGQRYRLWGDVGIRLGSEFILLNRDILLGPKLGMELVISALGIRGSLITYLQSGMKTDVVFLAEYGIALGGMGNFMYGYSIPITQGNKNLTRKRFTLSINL